MQPGTLGVIGLDAVGGSVAWQAARAGVPHILGYSGTPKDGVAAARAGAVTELLQDVRRVFRNSDFVVLSAAPRATMDLMKKAAPLLTSGDRFVTDVSRPDLFVGKIVYVTATSGGERAAGEVADFWHRVLGAQPVRLDARTHDSMVAWTRHLPHAAAAALAVTLGAHGPKGVTYGSETRSATALAAGQLDALADVLLLNRDAIVDALQTMDRSLHKLGAALASNDEERVRAWLDAASSWRSRLGS